MGEAEGVTHFFLLRVAYQHQMPAYVAPELRRRDWGTTEVGEPRLSARAKVPIQVSWI